MAKLKNTRVYGNLVIDDILTVSQDATILGNLNVSGTVTTVNSTTIQIEGPIVQQGAGANGTPLTSNDGLDRGLDLSYYSGGQKEAFMGWNTANSEFRFGSNVSILGDVVTFHELGNIHANYFIGNAYALTNIQGTNVDGNVATANYANYAGDVVNASQPNITSVGTLLSLAVGNDGAFANIDGNGNIDTSGIVSITNSTVSTSTSTGALTVTGGVGIGGNLYVGGTLHANVSGSTSAPGSNTDIVFNDGGTSNATGGFTFNKNSNTVTIGGNITLNGSTGNANITNRVNFDNGGIVGQNVQGGSLIGVDLYAPSGLDYTQLNYNDTQYIFADSSQVAMQTNSGDYTVKLDTNGVFTIPGNLQTNNYNFSVDDNGNVNASGFGSFADVYATNLAANRIVFPDSNGKLSSSTGLKYSYNTLTADNFETANANITGNITTQFANGNLLATDNSGNIIDSNVSMTDGSIGATNVTASANLQGANLTVTSLTTTGGILYTNNQGNVTESSGLTFISNTLNANNITTTGTANVANLQVTSITVNEVPYVDGTGTFKGNAAFTYTQDTSTLQANNITATQTVQGANLKATTLSGTQVVFSDADGVLLGDNSFTFDNDTLTANIINASVGFNSSNVHATNLHDHAIVIADGSGKLVDHTANGFAYYTSNSTLTANTVKVDANLYSGNVYANSGTVKATTLIGTIDATSSSQPNITSLGNLTSLQSNGNIKIDNTNASAGILTDNLYYANGQPWDLQQAAGSNTQIQFNDGSDNFGASANLTFATVGGASTLTVTGNANVTTVNATTGNITTVNATDLNATGNANITGNISASIGNITTINSTDLNATGNANITGNISANIGNITTVNSTNANITTGNITTVNSTNANITTANITTGNITTVNAGNISATGNANVTGNITVGGNASITGTLTAGDTTITGNLTVTGTTTSVNTTVSQLSDPLFDLGNGANGAALENNDNMDRGLVMHTYVGASGSGTTNDLFMGWDNSNSTFVLAKNVTVSENVVDYGTGDAAQANLADLHLGNIYAYNANFGGVVFSSGNITLGAGSFLNGDVKGNISGNIKVSGANGSLQFATNVVEHLGATVNAGSFVVGTYYKIISSGTTDFTSIGSSSNAVGTYFTATGAGAGTGTAKPASTYGDLDNAGGNLTYIDGVLTVDVGHGGNVVTDYLTGTLTTSAQPNITSVGTLTSLDVDGGNLTIANNSTSHNGIKTDYIYKTNGTPWDFATAAGPAGSIQISDGTDLSNVTNFTYSSGNLNVPGNIVTGAGSGGNITGANEIHANYFYGDGTNITGVTATSMNAANLTGTTLNSGVIYSNLTTVGTLVSLDVTGNITAGNVDAGNLLTANYVTGTLTTNAQPNITSLGTLTSANVSGNANVGNISTNAVSNTQVVYGDNNRLVGSSGFTFDAISNALSVTGTTTVGNLTITNGGFVTGNLIPSVDKQYNLGNATNAFKDLWLSGTSIHLGEQTISSNSTSVSTTATIVAGNLVDTGLSTNAIPYTTAGNLLSGDNYFTYDGSTFKAPNATIATSLVAGNVTSNALTETYVTFAGVNGVLTDDETFTFVDGLLSVGNVTTTGNIQAANIIDTALSTNAIPYTTTGNVLSGSSTFTYDGSIFKAPNVTVSGNVIAGNLTSNALSSTRVVFAGTGGILTSDTGLTYSTGTGLSTDKLVVNTSANLGLVGNITITGGTSGQYLRATAGNGLEFASVDTSILSNGTSNVHIATVDGNVTVGVAGDTILDIGTVGLTVTGIITATGNILGNNITSNNFITASGTTDATSAITGTIKTAGGISAQGNIYAGKAVGFANGSSNTSSAAYIQYNSGSGSLDFIFN